MVIGHLAVSALEHRYLKVSFPAVMAAALLPDVLDKALCYGFRLTSHGRYWGHSLLGMLGSTAIVALLWGRRVAAAWLLGYFSHLLCDEGGVVPWLHPWVGYKFPDPHSFAESLSLSTENLPRVALEVGLSVWAVLALLPQALRWWKSFSGGRRQPRVSA